MSEFDKIAAALVKAQAALKLPEKNREVTVHPKVRPDGTRPQPYKFWYTTFDELVENVRPTLTANGLWFTQQICGEHGKPQLKTTLWHESGQHIEGVMPIILSSPDAQAFGSAVSYAKRYALSALLGQPSDDDDDANAADGNAVVERKDKPRQNAQQPAAQAKPDASQTLSKADARPVFDRMVKEYSVLKTVTELDAWWVGSKRDRLSMPDDWRQELAARWTAHKKSILDAMAERHGIPADHQKDASQ